jgi:hypothetical protein
MEQKKLVSRVRGEVELAVLNFATDFHRYKNIREDVAFKGIRSHPKFIDEILSIKVGKDLTLEGLLQMIDEGEVVKVTYESGCRMVEPLKGE